MKIYTKTGDAGETGLYGGRRVQKTDSRVEALGSVDELNAAIGLCLCAGDFSASEMLTQIQNWLFDAGGELATPSESEQFRPSVGQVEIGTLESSIDSMVLAIPPLRYFILPGGAELAARLHVARTVCRRAERRILELAAKESVRNELIVFFNRLSDWLFTAARLANCEAGVSDVEWHSTETKRK